MDIFFDIRKVPGLKKKPSTSELIDWLKLIVSDDIARSIISPSELPIGIVTSIVGLPIFLYSIFSDGSVESNKKAFFIIGFFMSAWIILYGLVQANSNKFFFNKSIRFTNLK